MSRLRPAAPLLALALGACAFDATRDGLLCGQDDPCPAGLTCVEGLCQVAPAAPPPPDAAPAPPPRRPSPRPDAAQPVDAGAAPPPREPPPRDAAPSTPDAAVAPADAAPPPPGPPRPAPGCRAGALCLVPTDDAFHTEADQWFAGGPALEVVEIDDGPRRETFLRFDLTRLPAGLRLRSARLSLYLEAIEFTDDSGTLRFDVVDDRWSEADVFGEEPPPSLGRVIDLEGDVTDSLRPGTRLSIDCRAALDRALRERRTALAFGLEARESDAVRWRFRSKDAQREPPLLVIEPE
jgi:hypothetical protein